MTSTKTSPWTVALPVAPLLIAALSGGVLLGATGPAVAEQVTVTREDCRRLTRYVPDASVSADYQPGVDSRGRPVAPADLDGGTRLDLPTEFTFDIQIRPFDRESGGDDTMRGRLDETTLGVGRVIIKPDGRAYWNGRPMQDDESYELAERCRWMLRASR